MYSDQECPWYHLDISLKRLLGACLIIFGVGGVLLNVWMIITFVKSHLLSFKSHLLVLNTCTASLGRGILGGFPFAGPSAIAGKWLFGEYCCKLFAFMHQLLGVFQITSLAILCFERYFLAKRAKHGRELSIKFYIWCIVFCWCYSIVLSVPPLVGYGSFGCDITGTACTLDWRCFDMRNASFNLLVSIFGCVIPVIAIISTLWKAVSLNKRQRLIDIEWEQWSLTKSTIYVASFILLFWTPQAILAIWIAFSSWNRSYHEYRIPNSLAILAPLASEASTMVPLLCYLASEPRIRTALLGRCKKNYGIIKKGRIPRHFINDQ